MSSYRFKNWLTIDESAEYLTDLTEKNHTSEAVLNAVRGYYLTQAIKSSSRAMTLPTMPSKTAINARRENG